MKKTVIIGLTSILLGCSNGIIDEGIYVDEGMAYRVRDERSFTGVVKNERGQSREYLSYRKGRLINKKVVDRDATLIKERSYDSMGLLHGRSKDGGDESSYSHGILTGERRKGDFGGDRLNYEDGVLQGRQEIGGRIRYFDSGVETDVDPAYSKPLDKKIKWTEKAEEDYSGELYSRPTIHEFISKYQRDRMLEVRGYERGTLIYVKYYSEKGEKVSEYTFYDGDTDKVKRYSKYSGGMLSESIGYDEKGQYAGESMEQYSGYIHTENYTEGFLQGETVYKNLINGEVRKKGVYELGIFTGEVNGEYYLKGLHTPKKPEAEAKAIEIEEDLQGDSGLVKWMDGGYTFMDEYSEGRLIKSYKFYGNKLEKVRIPLEDGNYMEESYNEGLLKSRYRYNSMGEAEGEFLLIEHTGSRTVGNMKAGRLQGRSIHYHGDTIYYIDEYREGGSSYERTVYYDYDKKQVSMKVEGVFSDDTKEWVQTGRSYEYYRNGRVKRMADFGKAPTTEKNVDYTEYYEDGVVARRYTMDYSGYRFLKNYDSYSEEGTLISRWVYDENGNKVSAKEYNQKGEIIKDVKYDEYGREI